jgi:hypothetical protein
LKESDEKNYTAMISDGSDASLLSALAVEASTT